MAITKFITAPAATQRIGAASLRFNSTTVRQMRFVGAGGSGNGPFSEVADNDFLIFGTLGRLSGVQAVPIWFLVNTGTQMGIYFNNAGNTLGAFWRYASTTVTRDTSMSVSPVAPNVSANGSTFTWAWHRVGDQYRIGYMNGHDLAIVWSAWVTAIAATLGAGANWANYAGNAATYINSSASPANYFAGLYGPPTFVAVTPGMMADAGLDTDAKIAQVLRDPQRIFDAGRSGIEAVISYGDLHRGGSRLRPRFETELLAGDTLVCPVTAKTLTLEIGTNTGTGGVKPNAVMPDYTVPTTITATDNVGKDNQPPAQSYQPGVIKTSEGTYLHFITVVGNSSAKRHMYMVTCDADGNRLRPPVQVPFTWFYTDENGGVYSKAESKYVQVTGSPDNHWIMTGVVVSGERIVMHPSFHSEGAPTVGVDDTPAAGDSGWGVMQLLEYQDPAAFDADGFTVIEPMDDLVDWSEEPTSSSSHHGATDSYCQPAVISGDGGYDGSVVSAHRARDTGTGWNVATWYNPGFGTVTQQVQLTTPSGATMSAGIPIGTFDLGGGYFIIIITPRYTGAGSFAGMMGFIGHNGAGWATDWWSARTGEPLTLPVQRGEMGVQFGYPENDISPLSDAKACTTFEVGFAGGHVVNLFAIGGAASIQTATLVYQQLLLRSWKFSPATKVMGLVDEIDLTTIIGDVLGNDPNDSNNPEIQRYESSSSIQPCESTGGFVLWLRSRDGGTFTQGTHYSDFTTRYGKRVIGIYFHDPADLSKWAWLTDEDGVTLFEAWNVADDGGLSCGPHSLGVARSNRSPVVVYASVLASAVGSTVRPLIDASAAIARAAALFPSGSAPRGNRSRNERGRGTR